MPALSLTTAILAPIDRCFDLARSIDHHLKSMSATKERVVAGVTSGLIGLGQEVTWEARHFGLQWHLTSRITAYERPSYFQDTMVTGPFATFVHEHHFMAEQGGTTMRDNVEFRSPLGALGGLVDRLVLRSYLRRLLTRRNVVLKYIAERSESGSAV